jgi:hypothetical protein
MSKTPVPEEYVGDYTEFIKSGFYKTMQKELEIVTRERDEAREMLAKFRGLVEVHEILLEVEDRRTKRIEAQRDALRAEVERLRGALEKLARLGNGDRYGNSTGNQIAIAALTPAEVKHDD